MGYLLPEGYHMLFSCSKAGEQLFYLKGYPMPHIHIFLQELDHLYHAGDFDQYEHYWHAACQHAEHFFPGFTIAYAELYNSGSDRIADGSLRHVLVPKSYGVE